VTDGRAGVRRGSRAVADGAWRGAGGPAPAAYDRGVDDTRLPLPGTVASDRSDSASARRRVLLVGCGKLGARLGLRLHGAGHEVLGLRRTPDGLPAQITPLAADLRQPLPHP